MPLTCGATEIRTPDLLHAMRGDLVCLRRTGSDTGRSGGVDCLAVSGSVRHRLRRLSLRQSLDFQSHGKQRMSFRNAYHTDQREAHPSPSPALRLRYGGATSGRPRRGPCVSGPGSAGGCHRRCRGSAVPGDPQDTVHPGTGGRSHPRLLRRDIHVRRRPAGQPGTTLNRTGANFAGRRPRPHGASRPLLGAYRNARFCRICR
jgi:hypothetical protein